MQRALAEAGGVMAALGIDGGLATTRLSAADNAADRDARARQILSEIACDMYGVPTDADPTQPTPAMVAARKWRDDMYAVLGLTPAPVQTARLAPAANPAGRPRVVVSIRRPAAEDGFRKRGICRDEDPELFFAVGTSGPALLQIEQAKAVCRRCPVTDQCLQWALESGQDAGVWGGMSEDERRAHKRRTRTRPMRPAA